MGTLERISDTIQKQNTNMRIGFLIPSSVKVINGGVRRQATETAHHLQNFGLSIQWIESVDDLNDVDLLHIFVTSPEHRSFLVEWKAYQRKTTKRIPIVLSPVFFSPKSVSRTKRKIQLERLLHPLLLGYESEYYFKSELCNLADFLVPNTLDEREQVHQLFDIPLNRMEVIHNGVEQRFLTADASLFQQSYGSEPFILFAGQAGSTRKNVKKLLEVAPNLPARLVVIGDLGSDVYSTECKKLMKEHQVLHIPNLDHDDPLLASAYAAANVFVLPSLFETPGIAAMEAALAGTQIAITERGGTREYFGNGASYLNPYSGKSIVEAIQEAFVRDDEKARNTISSRYTWEKVASDTLAVYHHIIG